MSTYASKLYLVLTAGSANPCHTLCFQLSHASRFYDLTLLVLSNLQCRGTKISNRGFQKLANQPQSPVQTGTTWEEPIVYS